MKKIIVPSFLAALAGFTANMAIGYAFMFLMPSIEKEYETACLFRPWSDPAMLLFFLHPFYFALIFAWIWTKVKTLFNNSITKNALMLTTAYWLLATVPGMLLSYSSFPISLAITLSWAVGAFAQTFVMSLIIIKMLK